MHLPLICSLSSTSILQECSYISLAAFEDNFSVGQRLISLKNIKIKQIFVQINAILKNNFNKQTTFLTILNEIKFYINFNLNKSKQQTTKLKNHVYIFK